MKTLIISFAGLLIGTTAALALTPEGYSDDAVLGLEISAPQAADEVTVARRGADDRNHEVGDDHGGRGKSGKGLKGRGKGSKVRGDNDDGPGHDVDDDRGDDDRDDDGPNHDLDDDHGGDDSDRS